MRRAGPVSGILVRLLNTLKITFAITWKNLSLACWDPGIAMPGSRIGGLKIYHVTTITWQHFFVTKFRFRANWITKRSIFLFLYNT